MESTDRAAQAAWLLRYAELTEEERAVLRSLSIGPAAAEIEVRWPTVDRLASDGVLRWLGGTIILTPLGNYLAERVLRRDELDALYVQARQAMAEGR